MKKQKFIIRPSSELSEYATWFICVEESGMYGFDSEIIEILVSGDEGEALAKKIKLFLEMANEPDALT